MSAMSGAERQRREPSYFLYVVCTHRDGAWSSPIKVGITANLKSRLRVLQTGSPHKLTYFNIWDMATRPVAVMIESAFHDLQNKHKISGEWFAMDPRRACELIEFYTRSMFVLEGAATKEEVDRELPPIADVIPQSPVWS